jgi:hypothetical protein
MPLFIDLVKEFGQRGLGRFLTNDRLLEVPLATGEGVSAGVHANALSLASVMGPPRCHEHGTTWRCQ